MKIKTILIFAFVMSLFWVDAGREVFPLVNVLKVMNKKLRVHTSNVGDVLICLKIHIFSIYSVIPHLILKFLYTCLCSVLVLTTLTHKFPQFYTLLNEFYLFWVLFCFLWVWHWCKVRYVIKLYGSFITFILILSFILIGLSQTLVSRRLLG